MILNHIDLSVADVPQSRDFFVNNFDFNCVMDKGEMSVLKDSGGFTLVLTKRQSDDPPNYPARFHIGFVLDEVKAVEEKYEQLKTAGIELSPNLMNYSGGTMFHCTAPGAITVEVSCFR